MANGLIHNSDILLTRPDKSAGVVILNCTDYITKMATVLDDTSKFLKLGDLSLDDTHKLEIKLQMQFLELFWKKSISREVYELIRSIGLQGSRSYGLPKDSWVWIPLRPILSMWHTAQHALVKYINQLLNPVLEFYSGFCVGDSFFFFFFFFLLPLFVNSLLVLILNFWCLLILLHCSPMFPLMK